MLFIFIETLKEVLHNQVEQRYLLTMPNSRNIDPLNLVGIAMRFPISSLDDIMTFNNDLRQADYATNVVRK